MEKSKRATVRREVSGFVLLAETLPPAIHTLFWTLRSSLWRLCFGWYAVRAMQVTMMQVTESYLMSRLAPGLGTWLAGRKAHADQELCRALRLLQYHTQVGRACAVVCRRRRRRCSCSISLAV